MKLKLQDVLDKAYVGKKVKIGDIPLIIKTVGLRGWGFNGEDLELRLEFESGDGAYVEIEAEIELIDG